MSVVIVASGLQSPKSVDGCLHHVTPFIGSSTKGPQGEFGVGFYTEEKQAWIWGLILPHFLIHSWRAMKILEKVPNIITHGTPCDYYYAAEEQVRYWDQHRIDRLAKQFPNYERFSQVRAVALASTPTQQELETMLRVVEENELHIEPEEVERVLKERTVPADEILQQIRAADERRWEEGRKRIEEKEKAKLATPPAPPPPLRRSLFQRFFY